MIKKILLITLIFVYGCSSGIDKEKVKTEIQKKKDEIVSLKTEIKALEEDLKNNGMSDAVFKILVSVKKIKAENFEHFHNVNGIVEAVKEAYISPEIGGTIQSIKVVEGQRVKQNELLAVVNSRVIRSSISELKHSLKLADTLFEKRAGLWKKNIGSEIQYLEAKNQKESLANKIKTLNEQLSMTLIRAPFDGIIDNIDKKKGELAVPGLPIMQIVDISNVYIKADVSEAYLSSVRVGDESTITFPSYPSILRKGNIIRVGIVINPQNRTFQVTLKLTNSNEMLKPNIVAVLELRDFSEAKAMIVPSIIVKNDSEGSYLYRLKNSETGSIAEKIYVNSGKVNRDMIMIRSGIEFGDEIIMKGYNLVK
ncbi:MAG: efflux RND transporter periplasmic adaptor subunit, partial [Candidatus Aminicenantes bacterium]|nr:efflux RND transporter periplasmic adaptor subunit [Candidatus Aminicenantes bacterium]